MVCVIYSDEFLNHDTGAGHPESPSRLRAVVGHLRQTPYFDSLDWRSPQAVPEDLAIAPGSGPLMEALLRVHTPDYVAQVKQMNEQGGGWLDEDTPVSPQSYGVALLAVQAWLDGLAYVLNPSQHPSQSPRHSQDSPNGVPQGFVLARPPGHHAFPNRGMGFCVFSNAAIAALEALTRPNINRVAIVDWDVHHGNGTQAIVEGHPAIAYCSTHQMPTYPHTGSPTPGDRDNHVLNIPIPPGTDFSTYRPRWETGVLPFLKTFNPDLLIISAGYDATAADPLAAVNLMPEHYEWLTQSLLILNCPILLGLEGGYDVQTLAQCVDHTLRPLIPQG